MHENVRHVVDGLREPRVLARTFDVFKQTKLKGLRGASN